MADPLKVSESLSKARYSSKPQENSSAEDEPHDSSSLSKALLLPSIRVEKPKRQNQDEKLMQALINIHAFQVLNSIKHDSKHTPLEKALCVLNQGKLMGASEAVIQQVVKGHLRNNVSLKALELYQSAQLHMESKYTQLKTSVETAGMLVTLFMEMIQQYTTWEIIQRLQHCCEIQLLPGLNAVLRMEPDTPAIQLIEWAIKYDKKTNSIKEKRRRKNSKVSY